MAVSRIVFDDTWETVTDERPIAIASSPDGCFVAGQWGQVDGAGHAAVWEIATRRVAWHPEHSALAWCGDQILGTRYDRSTKRELLESYRWTDRTKLGEIAASYPIRGWLTHAPRIVASSITGTAAIVWREQTAGGVEIYRRDGATWTQLRGFGYWQDVCNYVGDPVFRDDGRVIALPIGSPEGWHEKKSAYCGVAVLFDVVRTKRHFIDLFAVLAPGWKPSPRTSPVPEIRDFETPTSLRIELQNQQVVSYSFVEAELVDP